MDITFDPPKRERTLKERGLDFADAAEVFEGEIIVETEDDRRGYGETRIITVRISAGPNGCGRMDASWLGSSRLLDAKGKRP